MSFVEPVGLYFADLGVDVTIDGASARGIFDDDYVGAGGGAFDGVASSGPRLLIAASAAPSVQQGTSVVIGARTYRVRVPQPDGTGMVNLPLERMS